MVGLETAFRFLALRSEDSCCSSVRRKAAGLEKSRFLSVSSTKSVANFSAWSWASRLAEFGVPPQGGVDSLLLGGIIDLQGLQHPLGESVVPEVVLGEFRLQASDHHRLLLAVELPGVGVHPAGEPLVVQELQQGREALRVAVVRRGGQEELVLEVRGQEADRPGAERVGGVLAPPGGAQLWASSTISTS